MSVPFRVLCFGCLLGGLALAEEGVRWAGLRITNALGQGGLKVEMNGQAWSPRHMEEGEVSALRRVKPGECRLRFSRVGFEGVDIRLKLEAGEVVTLVAHSHQVLPDAPRKLRVLKLDRAEATAGRVATVVDVGFEERRLLEIRQAGKSWQPIALRRMELQRFNIVQHRGYLPLRVGEQALASMPVFESGHHVIVLYDKERGRPASLCFRDRSWPEPEAALP